MLLRLQRVAAIVLIESNVGFAAYQIPLNKIQRSLSPLLESAFRPLPPALGLHHLLDDNDDLIGRRLAANFFDATTSLEAITVGLKEYHNEVSPAAYYTVEVMIGSPEAACHLILDLGSSDLVLKGDAAYNPSSSSEAHVHVESNFHIEYITANASGHVVSDKVCLHERLCVPQQRFAFATDTSGLWGADGIFGVGSPKEARVSGRTFWQNIAISGGYNHFAIAISLRSDDERSFLAIAERSELEDGYSGNCARVPFYDNRDYSMRAELSIAFSFTSLMVVPFSRPAVVVLDSGATSIRVPGKFYEKLMRSLIPEYDISNCRLAGNPKKATVCNCDTQLVVGDLVLTFKALDGKRVDIKLRPDDFMVKHEIKNETNDTDPENVTVLGTVCLFYGLMPGPESMPWWLLGANVFRHIDVIFGTHGDDASICPRGDLEDSVGQQRSSFVDKTLGLSIALSPNPMKPVTLFAAVGVPFIIIASVCITRTRKNQGSKFGPLVDAYVPL